MINIQSNQVTIYIKAKYIVIAIGSSVTIPKVKGLDKGRLPITNEIIFELKEKPKHLMIISGGLSVLR